MARASTRNPPDLPLSKTTINGYLVALNGEARGTCPYLGGDLREAWLAGWDLGERARKEWE